MNEVIYIGEKYILADNAENMYARIDFSDEVLGNIWANYNWELAEEKLLEMQCQLTKVAFKYKGLQTKLRRKKDEEVIDEQKENLKETYKDIRKIQDKITGSLEARMLAVRSVSNKKKVSAGIDGIRWRTNVDKIKAVFDLKARNYKAKPFRYFEFEDNRSSKIRYAGIPCMKDRAMMLLYSYALKPMVEAWADIRTFSSREGRSAQNLHAEMMDILQDPETTEWLLILDICGFYPNISHKWLLENIPMDKNVLSEFLKAGMVLENGECFPQEYDEEKGISLGCCLSPLLANLVLQGIQWKLWELQGEEVTDYKNGMCLNFVDDCAIFARTKQDAEKFLFVLRDFLAERGLKVSETKTKIVKISNGFDFLARHYVRKNNIVHCYPSEIAIDRCIENIRQTIFETEEKWTLIDLIETLNKKLNGWATYHRVTEAKEAFNIIDLKVNAMLWEYIKKTNPNSKRDSILRKKYWKTDILGRENFSICKTIVKRKKEDIIKYKDSTLLNLSDVILIKARRIDLKRNVYLNRDYFEEIEIKDVTGNFKKVWERQKGICYICHKKIQDYEDRTVITKDLTKRDRTIRNKVYIHQKCTSTYCCHIKYDNESFVKKILFENDDLEDKAIIQRKNSKFDNLTIYFSQNREKEISLTFDKIEDIIGSKLCASAYTRTNYFYNNQDGTISYSWRSQGYRLVKVDLSTYTIHFKKLNEEENRIDLPDFVFKSVPLEVKNKIENYVKNIGIEYNL